MDWDDLLKNRKQTFQFKKEKPPKELIDKILDEVHQYCPSKQKVVPWKLDAYDWSDPEFRKQVFYDAWCDSESLSDFRNPQVLAPYIFILGIRNIKLTDYEPISKDGAYGEIMDQINNECHKRTQATKEIGFAAMLITFSAINKGLHVGYCGSFNSNNKNTRLIIGVGYKDTSPTYMNPLTNKPTESRRTPSLREEHKPNPETYIIKHYK